MCGWRRIPLALTQTRISSETDLPLLVPCTPVPKRTTTRQHTDHRDQPTRLFRTQYFTPPDIDALQDAFDETRRKVWTQQPPSFFERATIDMDGMMVETMGVSKTGMDISYNGIWGYPLASDVWLFVHGDLCQSVRRPHLPSNGGHGRRRRVLDKHRVAALFPISTHSLRGYFTHDAVQTDRCFHRR